MGLVVVGTKDRGPVMCLVKYVTEMGEVVLLHLITELPFYRYTLVKHS